ncbi:amino acid permease [Altererythrobacter sp.]|uniref:amino acid permease n=1 Tax=Altererythrobacter sp. TaxID=1872480 RepID=UPI003D0206C5
MIEKTERPGRKLGLFAAIALVMGNMIGSGVFLLPASLAPYGWNAVGGWIVTIAGGLVLAWLLACLTRQLSGADDMIGFISTAFGKQVGFIAGWLYLLTLWIGTPTIAVAAISYLSELVPEAGAFPAFGALALLWGITLINLRSVSSAGNFQIVTLLIKLVPLLLVVVIAALQLASGNAEIAPFETEQISLPALSGAAALTLWALLGFESASVAAKQVRDPEVNVPRATILGTALTGLLYMVVCSAIAMMLPQDIASSSPAPFATFVERYWSAGPAALIAVFAIVSCIGAVNGWVLIQGELPRCMASKGELPRWFAVTDANGTPRRALIVSSLIGSVVLMLNTSRSTQGLFEFLLLLTTSAALWCYLGVALAAWKLNIARFWAVPGALYALWALWGAGIYVSSLSFALLLAGIPVWWWTRREARLTEQPV